MEEAAIGFAWRVDTRLAVPEHNATPVGREAAGRERIARGAPLAAASNQRGMPYGLL